MLLFHICHTKWISQKNNDPHSCRFLSLSFTKNRICEKILINWNQNAEVLILVLPEFFKIQSFPAKEVDIFIQAKWLFSRATNFQQCCWTHLSLSCLSGGLAQNKSKDWIFPGHRHSVLNSFSHLYTLQYTIPFQPVTEVTGWNLEGSLKKYAGAQ